MAYPYNSKFRLTSGYRTAERSTHTGVDLVGENKFICAIAAGTVGASTMITDKSNPTWQWGNYVRVDGDDGYYYYYCHMSQRRVEAGQRVEVGDHIGVEGSTGYSTGSHLHLEIRRGRGSATAINPADLMGIPNAVGTYGGDWRTVCRKRFGLSDAILRYIDRYQFAADLYRKFANPVGASGGSGRDAVAKRFGLSENTMRYLDGCENAADLYQKLVNNK